MRQTLIIYLHGIGDNVMLTGVLKEYCQLHPEETIDLVVLNPGCAAIWKNNSLVRSATVYPFTQPHFWNPLKFYVFHQWKVRRYANELNREGTYERILFPTIQTAPEILFHLTRTYGPHKIARIGREMKVEPRLYPYDLHTTPKDALAAAQFINQSGLKRFAIVHPFSGQKERRLQSIHVAQLLNDLHSRGLTTLVVGSDAERNRMAPEWKTESVFGLPLGTLIEIMKQAELFAGGDSAIAHLAAFAAIPRIIVFPPNLISRRYQLPLDNRSKLFVIPVKAGRETDSLAAFERTLDLSESEASSSRKLPASQ